jgi:hypothetical protein
LCTKREKRARHLYHMPIKAAEAIRQGRRESGSRGVVERNSMEREVPGHLLNRGRKRCEERERQTDRKFGPSLISSNVTRCSQVVTFR